MKSLASLVMRGRMQATAVATVLAALSLLILPLGLISGAVIALVALRHGLRESALVLVGGTLALAGLGGLIFGMPLHLALFGLMMWLPAWGLGLLLRSSRSLALTLEVGLWLAAGLVIGQYLLGDPAAYWARMLNEFLAQSMDSQLLDENQRQQVVASMAPWMIGGVASAWFLQQALVLFLARYWQAALYNPGGFRAEFHGLRLRRWVLLALPILLVLAMAGEHKAGWPAQLVLVLEAGLLLQGVALVHGVVGRLKVSLGWLIGFYSLLVAVFPYSVTLVTIAGYMDGWLDFRAKVRSRSDTEGTGE